MIRKPRASSGVGWRRWGTPYLDRVRLPGHLELPHSHAADLSVNYDALHLALLAEEQRQVFALLSRLRQTRRV